MTLEQLYHDHCVIVNTQNENRANYCKSINALIEDKAFDVLIFLNMGRLGRDAALSMAVVRLCQRAGIALYATESPPVSLDPSDSYSDSLINAVKAVGYQQEITELKRRTRIGMRNRIERGEFPSAIPWPWRARYDADGSLSIEVDEGGAAALHFIAEAYLNDTLGTTLIAQRLNDAGHLSPTGGEWKRISVSYVIRNALRYAGITEYNRRSETGREYLVAPSRWPAIWSEKTAQAILREKESRYAGSTVRSPHRFSRCVWCSICNRKMRALRYTVPSRKDYHYVGFRCDGKENGKNRHKLANVKESTIIDVIAHELNRLATLNDLATALPQEADHSAEIAARLDEANKRSQTFADELERADTAFTRGLMSLERYQAQVERINKTLTAVQGTITELEDALANIEPIEDRVARMEDFVHGGQAMLTTEDISIANAFFRNHIEIWVSEGRVDEIKFI